MISECEEYKKFAKKVIVSIPASPRSARQANLPFTGKFTIATEFPHMVIIPHSTNVTLY
jgi:hypothetical protein